MIRAILRKDFVSGWYWTIGVTLLMLGYVVLNLASWPAEFMLGRIVRPFAMLGVVEVDTRFPLVRLSDGALLAVLFGAGFGFWHALPEVGGACGFFFSRPCSRTLLAVGKLISGTVMFWVPGLVATGIAFGWCAWARLSAPLQPWMIGAPLLSWLIGYMFYLSAVSAAWRPAKWYGGRLLPMIPPIPIGYVMLESSPTIEMAWTIGLIYVGVLWLVDVYLLVRWEG